MREGEANSVTVGEMDLGNTLSESEAAEAVLGVSARGQTRDNFSN